MLRDGGVVERSWWCELGTPECPAPSFCPLLTPSTLSEQAAFHLNRVK
jgi:hypothetical protein